MEVRDFLDSCKCVRTSKDFHDNPAPPDFPPLSRGRLPLAEAKLIILYRHASVTVFFFRHRYYLPLEFPRTY